jgi:hypothetical protein
MEEAQRRIDEWIEQGSTFRYLNLSGLGLTDDQVPPLPDRLQGVDISRNQLTQIPALPQSLRDLTASGNQIERINDGDLPPSLARLFLIANPLTYLSEGSFQPLTNLRSLYISHTQLTRLPQLPDSIEHLECVDCQLTQIQNLPGRLQYFLCYDNQLTSLPPIGEMLREINCSRNRLTKLPTFPPHSQLRRLYANSNQIKTIPILPDSLQGFDVSNNPLIEPFKTIVADHRGGEESMRQTRQRIREAWASLNAMKTGARNALRLKAALGKTYNGPLAIAGIKGKIGSMLMGETVPGRPERLENRASAVKRFTVNRPFEPLPGLPPRAFPRGYPNHSLPNANANARRRKTRRGGGKKRRTRRRY